MQNLPTKADLLQTNIVDIDQLSDIGQLQQQVQTEIERLWRDGVAPEQICEDVLAMIKTVGKEKAPTATKPKGAFHNAD